MVNGSLLPPEFLSLFPLLSPWSDGEWALQKRTDLMVNLIIYPCAITLHISTEPRLHAASTAAPVPGITNSVWDLLDALGFCSQQECHSHWALHHSDSCEGPGEELPSLAGEFLWLQPEDMEAFGHQTQWLRRQVQAQCSAHPWYTDLLH